jgi:SAM-dependent methyltransferase
MDGIPQTRREPCRICRNPEGIKVGETEYWDLHRADLVACSSCGLIQLDPMPSGEIIATGCHAYYLFELASTPRQEQTRNRIRNFRRGILFGSLIRRKGFRPAQILEFGPGTGHFCAGIKVIFPESIITVADIVEDVLRNNEVVHGFRSIQGSPEEFGNGRKERYDLIIARDILEHVTDVGKVIFNISGLLKAGGLFHFLTPNGTEDAWPHILAWKLYHRPSELLINHVNYFDGKGLKDLLEWNGLVPLQYYTYQLKTTFRGKGWSENPKLAAGLSAGMSAKNYIDLHGKNREEEITGQGTVIPEWMSKPRSQWPVVFYCWLKHHRMLRIPPRWNTGHEIHGLFRKNQ